MDQTIKELDTYKLECEEAQSKVGQMEVIKKKMDEQLEATERECKVYTKKAEELEATQETELHSEKERTQKALQNYETNKMYESRQTYEAQKQQLKECKEKLKLEETKTNSEITEKIKISTEKDELQHQYNRLNAIVVEQDEEIKQRTQNFKQIKKEVEDKEQYIEDIRKDHEFNREKMVKLTEETMVQQKEIEALKKECGLYRDLKNIDIEEMKQMHVTNQKMTSNIEKFMNKIDSASSNDF